MSIAWRLSCHDSRASNMDDCIEQARQGAPEGLAILAHTLTRGRGQHGRSWQAPRGNLYLAVLLRPAETVSWALRAAVALAEAVEAHLPDPARLRLKWPNDLLLDGAKLSGILVESALAADGTVAWLVIGFGVNLAVAPALPDRPTACLGPISPEVFAQDLLARLGHWRMMDFPAVRAAWMRRGPDLATELTLGKASGVYEGLSEQGHLVLNIDGISRTFASGEVA